MKFIFLTDSHIKGVNPGRRKDIYYVSILKKFMELEYVIKNEDIDFVVHGGDLFDVPKVSNKLFGQIAGILKSWGKQVFVVPGNHDIYGQNINTLEHTSLGALAKAQVVTLMTRDDSPFYFQKKSEPNCPLIAFTGQEYYSDIDKGINDDYEVEQSKAKFNFLVAHGMLLDKPFHPDVAHTVMADVRTSADMVLSGHYHPGPIEVTVNNTRFLNPGSTARVEISKRMPSYAIIEVTDSGIDYKIVPFNCAEPSDDIFDFASATNDKQYKGTLEAFKKTVQDIDVHDANNINDILNKVATTLNSSANHIGAVINMITDAQKKETDKSLNGYIPDTNPVQLVKATLHNFQSHSHTEVDFTEDSLIALIGESDNGKTAIIRAIKWVLDNDPKGTDMIKQGETTCYATLEFSNGNKVTRQRTVSSAGYYEVYDAKTGLTQKYTGFGSTIPMEVFNAHQMPKIYIGKEQVSFNISEQLDGPFMLSQSASDRAAVIGKITGVQVVDGAIQEISKNISNLQRDIKAIERNIEMNEDELAKFSYLDKMEKDIAMGELILDGIDNIESTIASYKTLTKDIDDFNINLAIESHKYNQFSNLDTVSSMLDAIDNEHKRSLSIDVLHMDYLDNAIERCEVMSKLNTFPDLDAMNSLIGDITSTSTYHNNIKSINNELSNTNNNIANITNQMENLCNCDDGTIEQLDQILGELKTFNSLKTEYKLNEDTIKNIKETITNYENTLANTLVAYKEQMKSLGGTCPICGNHLEDSIIDTLEL